MRRSRHRMHKGGFGRCCLRLALVPVLVGCSADLVSPADAFPDEPAPLVRPEYVAFVDVNVVPMDLDGVLPAQTVIVRGDRVESIGPVGSIAPPEGAFRIEGRGRYLLPGLVDMHVHLTSQTFANLRNDFVLFLANGVTTVRVMWGSTGLVAERERIRAGEVLGPELLVASAGIDGPGGTWTGSTPPVANAAEARERVALHAATGYDFIKVYNDLSRASYDAIIEESAAHGLPVVGHVPWAVGIERVQDAGQSTLEHFIGVKLEAANPFTGGTLDMARVDELVRRSRDAGVWHTPTITVDALSRDRASSIQNGHEIRFVSPGMRDFFETGFHHGLNGSVAVREEANQEAITGLMREVGGRLLVGTDAGFGWILPGYSIHEEMGHFRHSGLSEQEVLRATTADPARAVGRVGEFGAVTVGARADLMLVVGNPLDDLRVLEDPSGVMVRGRWLSRGTLARMLEEIRAAYGT